MSTSDKELLDFWDDMPKESQDTDFDDELYEGFYESGYKPEDLLPGEERDKYAEWIMKNHPFKPALALKTNPYRDKEGQFSTKENDADGVAAGAKWEKQGSRLGSNEGGVYLKGGVKHYVKFPAKEGQIHSEQAADQIYEMMGVESMNHQAMEVNGRLASVSQWKDVKQLGSSGWRNLTEDQIQQVANAYVASALTKNWDVVGLEYDNMGTTKAGRIAIMDTGGSFRYRAQGGDKSFDGDATPELKTMLDPSKTSGRVYGPLFNKHKETFKKAGVILQSIADDKLVSALSGMNDKAAESAILERKKSILKFLGVSD